MRKRAIFYWAFLFALPVLAACGTVQNSPDAEAVEHYNQGEDYQAQGQWDLAIEEYTKAIETAVLERKGGISGDAQG